MLALEEVLLGAALLLSCNTVGKEVLDMNRICEMLGIESVSYTHLIVPVDPNITVYSADILV